MDQDRWFAASTVVTMPPTRSPSSTNPTSTSPSASTSNSRLKHDVAQALAMKRRGKAVPHNFESDVRLGLQKLDEADELRESGQLEAALDLYQKSIELLLHFIKDQSARVLFVDRDAVAARMSVALTDAESIKQQLSTTTSTTAAKSSNKKQEQKITSQEPTSTTSKSKKTKKTSTRKKKLSVSNKKNDDNNASVGSGTNSTITNDDNCNRPVTRSMSKAKTKTVSTVSPSSSSATSPSMSSTVSHQVPGQSTNSGLTRKASTSRYVTPAPPKQTPKPSPLVNSQDPLVQTIKTDMYVDPSQLSDVSWDDIAGLQNAKQSLQEAAILPMVRPDLFTGLRKPRNILLYGPPGTGKTMLVRAVAKESNCLLFACSASALTSKWHGEGEKLVRTLFQVARAAAPSIIFIDEMDALLSARKSDGEHEASRRFKTEFMTQMDGITKDSTSSETGRHILVVACTNCPWDIDSAVLRRFPRRIHIPLPDPKARAGLLQKLMQKIGRYSLTKQQFLHIVSRTEGFSGSDLTSIASEAAFEPLRSLGGMEAIQGVHANDVRPVSLADFEKAINEATKSVSKTLLKQYKDWEKEQAAS